ncbi:MAG: Uncharacterized MFS-type transporter, partial [uncultured Rubrobacteraceae bacterium]
AGRGGRDRGGVAGLSDGRAGGPNPGRARLRVGGARARGRPVLRLVLDGVRGNGACGGKDRGAPRDATGGPRERGLSVLRRRFRRVVDRAGGLPDVRWPFQRRHAPGDAPLVGPAGAAGAPGILVRDQAGGDTRGDSARRPRGARYRPHLRLALGFRRRRRPRDGRGAARSGAEGGGRRKGRRGPLLGRADGAAGAAGGRDRARIGGGDAAWGLRRGVVRADGARGGHGGPLTGAGERRQHRRARALRAPGGRDGGRAVAARHGHARGRGGGVCDARHGVPGAYRAGGSARVRGRVGLAGALQLRRRQEQPRGACRGDRRHADGGFGRGGRRADPLRPLGRGRWLRDGLALLRRPRPRGARRDPGRPADGLARPRGRPDRALYRRSRKGV